MWSWSRAGTAPCWRGEETCSKRVGVPWHSQDRASSESMPDKFYWET